MSKLRIKSLKILQIGKVVSYLEEFINILAFFDGEILETLATLRNISSTDSTHEYSA